MVSVGGRIFVTMSISGINCCMVMWCEWQLIVLLGRVWHDDFCFPPHFMSEEERWPPESELVYVDGWWLYGHRRNGKAFREEGIQIRDRREVPELEPSPDIQSDMNEYNTGTHNQTRQYTAIGKPGYRLDPQVKAPIEPMPGQGVPYLLQAVLYRLSE